MDYEQWLEFQSIARAVMEPRHKVQLEELDKQICAPFSSRIADPLRAFSAAQIWAEKYMFHHHTNTGEKLALEMLSRVSFFAWCTANNEGVKLNDGAKGAIWQETRRICNQLAPYLPEPHRAALLALLPVEDAAIGMPKPLPRQRAQEQAILHKLSELNYAPLQLPKNPLGKKGVKAEVKEKLLQATSLFSNSSFDKAWERLSSAGEIRIS